MLKTISNQQKIVGKNGGLQTADALKHPDGAEFRSAFLAYLEWDTLITLYKLRYHRLHPDFWIRQSVLWLNDDLTFCGTLV